MKFMGLRGFYMRICCRFQVSVFRFQDLAIRLPDTPNLTPILCVTK